MSSEFRSIFSDLWEDLKNSSCYLILGFCFILAGTVQLLLTFVNLIFCLLKELRLLLSSVSWLIRMIVGYSLEKYISQFLSRFIKTKNSLSWKSVSGLILTRLTRRLSIIAKMFLRRKKGSSEFTFINRVEEAARMQ